MIINPDSTVAQNLLDPGSLQKFVSSAYVKSVILVPTKTDNSVNISIDWLTNRTLADSKSQYPFHYFIDTSGTIFELIPLEFRGEVISYLDQSSWYVGMAGGANALGKDDASFNENQLNSFQKIVELLDKKHKNLFKRFLFNNSIIALRI